MIPTKISSRVWLVAATLLCGCAPAPKPVIVTNPTDIAKAAGIQQPYQARADCNFAKSFPDACDATIATPPSQRLVIEFVSASCGLASRVTVIQLGTFVNGGQVFHKLIPNLGYVASQQVRIYADPSSNILFNVLSVKPETPAANCFFSISGQAVSVP